MRVRPPGKWNRPLPPPCGPGSQAHPDRAGQSLWTQSLILRRPLSHPLPPAGAQRGQMTDHLVQRAALIARPSVGPLGSNTAVHEDHAVLVINGYQLSQLSGKMQFNGSCLWFTFVHISVLYEVNEGRWLEDKQSTEKQVCTIWSLQPAMTCHLTTVYTEYPEKHRKESIILPSTWLQFVLKHTRRIVVV